MLSVTSEYALCALARLAQLARGQSVLGRDLAEATGVPAKYLAKIMLALRNAGIVMATRGTGGGYMLLRPPDAIHLIDIVQVFEGPSLWPHCLLRPGHECSERHPCSAHSSWGKAGRMYLELLERTRLCDISSQSTEDHPVSRATKRSEARAAR